MKERMKLFGVCGILLGLAMLIANFFSHTEPSELLDEPLREEEASRIVIEDRKISVLSKKGTKASYVPSSGHAVVSTKKDGDVHIDVKQGGFSLQGGFGAHYSDVPRLTLDLQLAYYRRFGFHVGIGAANARPAVTPYAAVSYRLDQIRLANTSLVVGVTARKEPLLGLRVEL